MGTSTEPITTPASSATTRPLHPFAPIMPPSHRRIDGSMHHPSAIDIDSLPRDAVTPFGCQKNAGSGDVLRQDAPLPALQSNHLVSLLRGDGPGFTFSQNRARRDAVDVHIKFSQLSSQSAGEPDQASFGRDVVGKLLQPPMKGH